MSKWPQSDALEWFTVEEKPDKAKQLIALSALEWVLFGTIFVKFSVSFRRPSPKSVSIIWFTQLFNIQQTIAISIRSGTFLILNTIPHSNLIVIWKIYTNFQLKFFAGQRSKAQPNFEEKDGKKVKYIFLFYFFFFLFNYLSKSLL